MTDSSNTHDLTFNSLPPQNPYDDQDGLIYTQGDQKSAEIEEVITKRMEFEEITQSLKNEEQPKIVSREEFFFKNYPNSYFIGEKILDVQDTLANTKIEFFARAKMVDWILEVLIHFQPFFECSTFFRAVLIMDQYIKYSNTLLENDDIHLIGITCMYISSKYEDSFPIPLRRFSEKASHGKYSTEEIQHAEMIILRQSGYCISYKSYSETTSYYCEILFGQQGDKTKARIRIKAIHFLIICVHDVNINNWDSRLVTLAAILTAIKYLINELDYSGTPETIQEKGALKHSKTLFKSGIKEMESIKHFIQDVNQIASEIGRLLFYFETNFAELNFGVKITELNKNFLNSKRKK